MNQPMHLQTNLNPNQDYHSYANVDHIRVKHLHLILQVDFEKRTLSGSVGLSLQHHQQADNNELILDTRDIHIQSIIDSRGEALAYRFGESNETLGTPTLHHASTRV